ncbi:MAG TPA: hypothetical protein PKE45_12355 [Caldilineaceae bacterium]|nr:hypothetical protein [Caldilineaceae bacterium]
MKKIVTEPTSRRAFFAKAAVALSAAPAAAKSVAASVAQKTVAGKLAEVQATASMIGSAVPMRPYDDNGYDMLTHVLKARELGVLPDGVWEAFVDRFGQSSYETASDVLSLRSVSLAGVRAIQHNRRHKDLLKYMQETKKKNDGMRALDLLASQVFGKVGG